jgi:FdhE protein
MAAPTGGVRLIRPDDRARAVRQGEVVPSGKWTGAAGAGVSAPLPLILPDPARRFAATARRLDQLAIGHPMEEWLGFMAQLAKAQHEAVATFLAPAALDPAIVEAAVLGRAPPLATDRYEVDPSWQLGLATILQHFDAVPLPDEARAVIADLESIEPAARDALASAFLRGVIEADQIGPALYVAAALQVHLTSLAATLAAESLRLLPQRGLCPCCGSTPVTGLVTASGRIPGTRYLYCSLCSTAWNHVRAVCITCGESGTLMLESVEGDNGAVTAETCRGCRTYAKLLYEAKDTQVDPYADDLASLALDVLVGEAGWSRHAPNPLLLMMG